MDVVIRGPVINHQSTLQILHVVHCVSGFISLFVFLRNPHVSLGVNCVVVIKGCGWRGSRRGLKYIWIFQNRQRRRITAVRGSIYSHAILVDIRSLIERLYAGSLVVDLRRAELQINRIEEFLTATGGAS